MITIRKLTNY